jgi:hypothetical protein
LLLFLLLMLILLLRLVLRLLHDQRCVHGATVRCADEGTRSCCQQPPREQAGQGCSARHGVGAPKMGCVSWLLFTATLAHASSPYSAWRNLIV